jgi:hypothetical protein
MPHLFGDLPQLVCLSHLPQRALLDSLMITTTSTTGGSQVGCHGRTPADNQKHAGGGGHACFLAYIGHDIQGVLQPTCRVNNDIFHKALKVIFPEDEVHARLMTRRDAMREAARRVRA